MKRLPTATAVATLAAVAVSLTSAVPAGASAGPGSDDVKRPDPHSRAKATKMPNPLVVAHRGASGYRPEHTVGAYELAVQMGADYIEPDLVMTKDGVLVDRHEPEISGTTDVAAHPEFAARKTTKVLDGTPTTGWFTEDFTLAELRTLRAKERLPQVRQRNTIYDGRWQVPTFEEVLQLREKLSKQTGRTIGIIPEIKHSTYFHAAGLDPEKAFVQQVTAHGLNKRNAPLWLQSFEITNLKTVRKLGYKASSTFLSWTGNGPLDGPYDLISRGDTRKYSYWNTPEGLRQIARFADGIGPEKFFVIPKNADGTLGKPTSLVGDAHRLGLKVIPWTFRNENQFMAKDFWNGTNPSDYGKAVEEQVTYLKTGLDGLFTDNPDTGVIAREDLWAGR
ncbi:glycerophosphodiester phosphodiesterase [Arsenicicoccus piscis]|uniref:glycerophosphodiester phosphodiesterase n=1 Tax=Arsenicicoccus piscis TaxID=673954 RepID=A0ABQ6HNQ9_9MICO|nr:glycerophosphodiester phosphodiesterase [Arsenicicoccus piscis]MCH8628443.1 glycerophosphodiester phosphodiesterase [Arsenicicoccus piscis]GMA19996.1 glycerophosphoryl diester phosphodiesterase [Arsenicicoccus piscis]